MFHYFKTHIINVTQATRIAITTIPFIKLLTELITGIWEPILSTVAADGSERPVSQPEHDFERCVEVFEEIKQYFMAF